VLLGSDLLGFDIQSGRIIEGGPYAELNNNPESMLYNKQQ
jgi:hypothetical protein